MRHALIAMTLSAAACAGDDPCDPDAPGTICTIAGDGRIQFSGDGGAALAARMNEPQEVAVAPDGEVWISDFNNYVIRAVDEAGVIRSAVGCNRLGDSPSGGETRAAAATAAFNHTPSFTFHDGYAYLASWHNRRIKRIELATMMVENIAGTGVQERYFGDGGPPMEAAVDLPSSVAIDPEGRVVWMSQADQVIRRIGHDGNVERIAGVCIAGELIDRCEPGEEPVACPGSNRTVCGDPARLCGEFCAPGFAGDGGPALEARLAQGAGQPTKPGGRIAFDAAGDLYFADRDNHRIRRIRAVDGVIETIAGTGEADHGGDGGPALAAALNQPIDVELAPDGAIFFTDTGNSCVRRIAPDGTIDAVAGRCRVGGEAPGTFRDHGEAPFGGDGGPPTDALLNWPYGIGLDGDRLYIADSYNQRVRVVNL